MINDVEQASVALHPATPFIEASTLAVLDVDITKVDVQAAAKWMFEQTGMADRSEFEQLVAMVSGYIDSLKSAGVTHLFVTGSTRSWIDGGPLVIVPCRNPAVVKGLASGIVQGSPTDPPLKIHVDKQLVLGGAQAIVDRVADAKGTARGDLILPLIEPSRLDHSIVISLPAEARDELIAMWPDQLPEPAPSQFSPRQMVEDVDRVVVTFRLPPDPQVHARIETGDASAAARVKQVVEKIIALSPEAKQSITVKVDVANVLLEASPEMLAKVAAEMLGPAHQHATQLRTMKSLKQLALAMHNYHASEQHLPPRCLTDREGKPLHSWIVPLLPYLDQQALYSKLRLDQPWDSEQNRPFTQIAIPLLIEDKNQPTKTRFRVPVYPGSLWQGEGPPKSFKDVTDGTSNTIAAIHAPPNAAIEWSNPEPWVLSVDDPMSDVFGNCDRVEVVLLDGSARVHQGRTRQQQAQGAADDCRRGSDRVVSIRERLESLM